LTRCASTLQPIRGTLQPFTDQNGQSVKCTCFDEAAMKEFVDQADHPRRITSFRRPTGITLLQSQLQVIPHSKAHENADKVLFKKIGGIPGMKSGEFLVIGDTTA
jgi:hypothetical protein